ncbi:MAG: 3-hydroxyacyl-ACP dehydratase FabZ [Synergistales bacterium]|jgi:3-hydroxyacyl-[acyl-carrier-protein] dehydratase
MIDIHGIMKHLPHRYPFLLVDRILELDENRVVGLKNVTINEPFFQGHFPVEPVMPGVLVLESMGQVAGMMIASRPGIEEDQLLILTTLEDVKFRRPVRPGDQLVTEAEMLRLRGRMGKVKAVARVDGELVAEGVFGFLVIRTLRTEEEK